MQWFSNSHRPMPWKGEKNPYLIWLSEIILQQTRVEQGLPYFEKFKNKYPAVTDLANAPEDEVMKMWEGLGYYSRARNLHTAAKYIANELGGIFPNTHKEILGLKGVGPYTAAAIASFAYGLPYAVVDGNVYRVLSRYFGIEEPIDTTSGKKLFAALAQELLDEQQAGDYNQAIMDFGATQCTPASPACGKCPFVKKCSAFELKKINSLPVKSKKLKRRQRFFNYLILNLDGKVFIKKRVEKDIWRDLYEFPMIETNELVENEQNWRDWLGESKAALESVSQPMKQDLTHQRIIARFWEISIEENGFEKQEESWLKINRENIEEYAFPKVIDMYLRQNFLTLRLF